jgi:hypothetical protein
MHDDDDWDEEDTGDDGYVPCPYCGETMLEDAEYCPYCERWISSEDIPRKPWPIWMVVMIVLCLAGLILSAFRGF